MKGVSVIVMSGLSTIGADAKPETRLPTSFSLSEARQLALDINPELKIASETIAQQDGVLSQIKAARLPHLDVGGEYTLMDEGRVQQFGDGPSSDDVRWDVGLEAKLTVFAGGRAKKLILASHQTREALEDELEVVRQRVLLDMHVAYYDAGLAQASIREHTEAVRVLGEQRKEAKARHDAGVGTKFELLQAKVALANAGPPLIRAKNAYRLDIDRLRQIIGLRYADGGDGSGIAIKAPPKVVAKSSPLDAVLIEARENRPEFHRMASELAASQSDVDAVRREHRPVVDLVGGYGIMNDQFGGEDSLEGWRAGLRLNWNLIDGGAHQGRLRERLSRHREVDFRHEQLSLSVEGDIRRAHYDHQEASAIHEVASGVIESAEEALRLSQNRFKAGIGTQLDVLN